MEATFFARYRRTTQRFAPQSFLSGRTHHQSQSSSSRRGLSQSFEQTAPKVPVLLDFGNCIRLPEEQRPLPGTVAVKPDAPSTRHRRVRSTLLPFAGGALRCQHVQRGGGKRHAKTRTALDCSCWVRRTTCSSNEEAVHRQRRSLESSHPRQRRIGNANRSERAS